MTKDYLHNLAREVMEEFGDTVFPEFRVFLLYNTPKEAQADGAGSLPKEEWWIEFECAQCTSGSMPRLILTLPYDASDERVRNELRGHVNAHISENHAA